MYSQAWYMLTMPTTVNRFRYRPSESTDSPVDDVDYTKFKYNLNGYIYGVSLTDSKSSDLLAYSHALEWR
jgi:hypothetical protein